MASLSAVLSSVKFELYHTYPSFQTDIRVTIAAPKAMSNEAASAPAPAPCAQWYARYLSSILHLYIACNEGAPLTW